MMTIWMITDEVMKTDRTIIHIDEEVEWGCGIGQSHPHPPGTFRYSRNLQYRRNVAKTTEGPCFASTSTL